VATINHMDVTAQLLHDVEFREAKRGGYNTHDVDEFLERLAVGLERQEQAVDEARQRIEAAEARAAEAERRAATADQVAVETAASQETLKRTLVLAQKTADAAIREAEEQAAELLAYAHAEAERLIAEARDASEQARASAEDEARAAQEQARARVLGEMVDLENARERLREDVRILERHLDEQRDRVRAAVHELQRMLDDPESLLDAVMPELSDVHAPVEPRVAPAATLEADAPVSPEDDASEWDDADPADPGTGADEDADAGPATQPVPVLDEAHDADEDDDAYLTELRKAMTDDTPLGPRDDVIDDPFDTGADVPRSRFGRRR